MDNSEAKLKLSHYKIRGMRIRTLLIIFLLLLLAAAVVPYRDEKLAQFFKVPINDEGFFAEAHVKLAPSDLPNLTSPV